jgi:hypothetical protein
VDEQLKFIEVKDITRTPFQTPDGRHFIAYKLVGKRSRRFSIKLWTDLKGAGIGKKGAQDRKKIRPEAAEHLMSIIQTAKTA